MKVKAAALALYLMPLATHAQASVADSAVKISFGGFVDGYYAYDFRRPPTMDRALTTQAARHNEFNVNLAFVDATLSGPRLRGRFAAQFGTSVQANYAGEPRLGTLSGPDVSRFIQEATAGYQVAPTLWVDAGVFFSPFGSENWISRDNWTYTRSLIAENSPYYEAGVKATWQATRTLVAQLHVINGWQNISETNSDKALGARLDFTPRDAIAMAYDAFVGNEQPDSLPSRLRVWQEGVVQLKPSADVQLRATFDLGSQQRQGGGSSWWRGAALLARYQLSPRVAAAGRIEYYSDPEQVIVITGHPYGVRASGGSLNADVALAARLLWRIEFRTLSARDPLFPDRSRRGLATTDPVIVTSIALTF
ncbi:MAG TPA: porin [Gemmatimonadaceae bacterium]